jgi:hypothetical protein
MILFTKQNLTIWQWICGYVFPLLEGLGEERICKTTLYTMYSVLCCVFFRSSEEKDKHLENLEHMAPIRWFIREASEYPGLFFSGKSQGLCAIRVRSPFSHPSRQEATSERWNQLWHKSAGGWWVHTCLLTRELTVENQIYSHDPPSTTSFLSWSLTLPPKSYGPQGIFLLKRICKAFMIIGHVLKLSHENVKQRMWEACSWKYQLWSICDFEADFTIK